MGLKAMAEAALQQCAPRTIDRTLSEIAPAHYSQEIDIDRTFQAANDADAFWRTLGARIAECDRLIHQLCNLRGEEQEYREELLTLRMRMAPAKLDTDIEYLRREIQRCQKSQPSRKGNAE